MSKIYVLTQILSFEVAESDLGEMEWEEARQCCLRIGDRWRLPTKEELYELLRLHQKAVGDFKFGDYWSSEYHINNKSGFAINFTTGNYHYTNTSTKYFVRLVRNI